MKTDARVRYTQMRIKEAFLACLAEKPVNKITVKELCDQAEINRATFYKHYADPFDLLKRLEDEALEWIGKNIGDNLHQQDTLLIVLRNICDRDSPYAALISSNGNPGFAASVSKLLYQGFQSKIAQALPTHTGEEQSVAYSFIAGGCGNVLSKWIEDGKQVPPEKMAAILEDIINAFVASFRCSS